MLLPPYSPELNPVENLWHYMRSHYLSNRSYADYDALLDAGTEAYRRLDADVIQSVCRCEYIEGARMNHDPYHAFSTPTRFSSFTSNPGNTLPTSVAPRWRWATSASTSR